MSRHELAPSPVSQEAPAPRPGRRRGWRWLARAAFSLLILGSLILRTEWEPIRETLAQVQLGWCAASLAVLLLAQLVSSRRWQMLAKPLGFVSGLGRFFGLYLIGMFFNLFLPTSMGGDVVKAWYLAGEKTRRWPALVSVFSERFSGLLALLLIAALATLPEHEAIPTWTIMLAWGAFGGTVLGMLALPYLAGHVPRLQLVAEGAAVSRGHWRRWLAAFGLSLVVQAAGILHIAMLGWALGLPAPLQAYAVAVPLVSLLTMLPISVNGVGVREGSLVLFLSAAGVATAQALALGFLWFAVLAVISVLGGFVYLFGRPARPTLKEQHGPLRGHPDQGRAGQRAAAA